MNYGNINDTSQQVSFADAVRLGLGRKQGLFFPQRIEPLNDIDDLLGLDFVTRSQRILQPFVSGSIDDKTLLGMLTRAFDFPIPIVDIDSRTAALELFHGPSLAFKDFGARFMAECLRQVNDGELTILTATSGDTGAAVAHAFYRQPGIRVVVLYPQGKISPLQEKLFCTLGENIHTFAVHSDFDACQQLVKAAFDDAALRQAVRLNSANSINISRLLAQVCYYFEAVAHCGTEQPLVMAVPSGNFGNVTAGLLARTLGLPIRRLLAATNANDTVPRYLRSGQWIPRTTVPTLTNAMDVSEPNNFPRIAALAHGHRQTLNQALRSVSISEQETIAGMQQLYAEHHYLADPHSALAYQALCTELEGQERGVFLCTAHPAKFKEAVEAHLKIHIDLPAELKAVEEATVLSEEIPADFARLKQKLLDLKP